MRMMNRSFRNGIYVVVAFAAFAVTTPWAAAQNAAAPATAGETPRMPDGHPDLSGMWAGGGGGGADADAGGGADNNDADIVTNVGSRRCAPNQVKCDEHSNQSYD